MLNAINDIAIKHEENVKDLNDLSLKHRDTEEEVNRFRVVNENLVKEKKLATKASKTKG